MKQLKDLENMAAGVRDELDKMFRFLYKDSEVNAYLGDASRKRCMKTFLAVEKLRGAPESEVKKQMEYLSKPNSGTGISIGDVSDMDYAVFVNGMSNVTPIVLGEEITHGEHQTEHVRRLGSVAGFRKEFSDAAIEFLGYLGMYCMAKKVASAGNSVILDTTKADDAHNAGYNFAKKLISSGKEIPYPDIFHAKNKEEIRNIFNDIIVL